MRRWAHGEDLLMPAPVPVILRRDVVRTLPVPWSAAAARSLSACPMEEVDSWGLVEDGLVASEMEEEVARLGHPRPMVKLPVSDERLRSFRKSLLASLLRTNSPPGK